ncbi:MAG: RNA polymerase sigma factor (sigma-70 family) [Desulforhopalus sp.]|jgi:RNA polymerase sigma factor (sigma-70 family)
MIEDGRTIEESDKQLMARLCAGESLVLNVLMERYQEPLYHFVLRYIHDEHLAYDIVQESFVRVYTRATSFNPEFRFKTWLYQIALNLCRDRGRRKALRSFFSFNEAEEKESIFTGYDAGIEEKKDIKDDIALLQKEIAKLPHKLKSALILFSLEEKSQIESAEILGVSPKTIETRVYRAKKILEKKMKQ